VFNQIKYPQPTLPMKMKHLHPILVLHALALVVPSVIAQTAPTYRIIDLLNIGPPWAVASNGTMLIHGNSANGSPSRYRAGLLEVVGDSRFFNFQDMNDAGDIVGVAVGSGANFGSTAVAILATNSASSFTQWAQTGQQTQNSSSGSALSTINENRTVTGSTSNSQFTAPIETGSRNDFVSSSPFNLTTVASSSYTYNHSNEVTTHSGQVFNFRDMNNSGRGVGMKTDYTSGTGQISALYYNLASQPSGDSAFKPYAVNDSNLIAGLSNGVLKLWEPTLGAFRTFTLPNPVTESDIRITNCCNEGGAIRVTDAPASDPKANTFILAGNNLITRAWKDANGNPSSSPVYTVFAASQLIPANSPYTDLALKNISNIGLIAATATSQVDGLPHTLLLVPPNLAASYLKENDIKLGGDQNGDCGMAQYSAHAMLASLNIEDTPLRYSPPVGPAINFTVTYNQKESQQPATFNYSNLGPNWTFNWISYVVDDPTAQAAFVSVYLPGGGSESYRFDGATQTFTQDPQSHATLTRTGTNSYERVLPDGSKQIFNVNDGALANPRKLFLSQWIDPIGNGVTISYDASLRITSITDAIGQVTTLKYNDPTDPFKISKVIEPFPLGRFAAFTYTNGQLTTITDQIGIQSRFHYLPGTNFIDQLTTPYGTSFFATGQSTTSQWLEMTDPLGGRERIEYRDNTPSISPTDPSGIVPGGFTNAALDIANTFYWTKKAIELYPPVNGVYDYTKAKITHWAKNVDESLSGIVASEKAPLENRVWYAYTGQIDTNHAGSSKNPNQIARVLDDGTTQLSQFTYNSLGNVKTATDPGGRVTSYQYKPNNIDLLNVYQRNPAGASTDPNDPNPNGAKADKIASYTYDPQGPAHLPQSYTDAAGQTTTYTYRPDGHGQIQSIRNPKLETTTYSYGPATNVPGNYLASITSPQLNGNSAVTSFAYDAANRVRTVTNNPDAYFVTTDYDNLDRPIELTYPDGTHRSFDYVDPVRGMTLDLTHSYDRRGRLTTRHYDSNRHMDSITEPFTMTVAGTTAYRTTSYGWCRCGALESITDPRGAFAGDPAHTTTFNRDLQSRVISKVFPDNTSISYAYENTTSRLTSMTDALNQTTGYSYYPDDNPKFVFSTPTVHFEYDPNYNRLASMAGPFIGANYDYYPVTNPPALGAGQLRSVGILPSDTIVYTYDELNRVVSQSVGGVTSSVHYDSLGRVDSSDNVLGHFSRTYVGVTPRLQTLTYPNGQTANYSYFDNSHDRRLQTVQNVGLGSVNLSKFDYTYDPEGQILTWTKQLGATVPALTGTYSYDLADELTTATSATLMPPGSFAYGYDLAGNRTTDQVAPGTHMFNNINQTQDAGYVYDKNGNLVSDGVLTYSWDQANRLVAIQRGKNPVATGPSPTPNPCSDCPIDPLNTPTPIPTPTSLIVRSEFSYNGLGRLERVLEKQSNAIDANGYLIWTVTSDNVFIWSGNTLVAERPANNDAVWKRLFAEGEQINGVNYYFTRDHLGSIREMTNSTASVQAQYEYDPYGVRTKLTGNLDADFGFTGHWHHALSGLDFSRHRGYSSTLGRWISRDPIGENGGLNLYGYVGNRPVSLADPLGLLWYEDLAHWARKNADYYERALDFNLPWQVAGVGDTGLELLAGLLSTPDAISHLGEGTGTWSVDPCWETSPGLFMDISMTSGILAGAFAPTEIGNSSVGWKGGEVTFTRAGARTPDLRINPFGGSGYPPHYHRRPGIGNHRPWEGGW
jgi:RHS repeat-associated protein